MVCQECKPGWDRLSLFPGRRRIKKCVRTNSKDNIDVQKLVGGKAENAE